jgi:lipoprotein-anchoring transpeptidase ErfK/SrfK
MLRLLTALVAAAILFAPAAAEAATVRVYLTRGEQLAAVKRDVSGGAVGASVTMLLQGPTAAQRRAGYGTAIPAGSRMTSARVDASGELATFVFSRGFGAGAEPDEYEARLAQVVYTATAVAGVERVRISVPGRATRTLARADFAPEPYVEPRPPQRKVPSPQDARAVQTRLAELTYLPPEAVTGGYDYRTQQAVIAFQAWEGLTRDGVVGPKTAARLAIAGRPLPLARTSGRSVEIYRRRGVVLLVSGGRVRRAIHTSTGVGGDSPDLGTPPGKFRIYRKELRSWSVPYKSWLPFAAYWVGGWALHGYGDVPARPASHGCARLPLVEAKIVYDFVSIGTPVRVI